MIFLRILLYVSVFFMTLIAFFPMQKAVDYSLNKFAKKHEVQANIEMQKKYFLHFAQDISINRKNERFAHVKSLELKPYLARNTLELQNVELLDMFAALFPAKIESILASYSILNPNKVLLEAKGDFGTMQGYVNTSTLFIQITPSALMLKQFSYTLGYMKKQNDTYVYELAL